MKNNSHIRLLVLLVIGGILVTVALFYQSGRFSEARKQEMLDDVRILPAYSHDRQTVIRMLDDAHDEVFSRHYRFGGRGFNPNAYRQDLVDAMRRMASEQNQPHLIDEFKALLPID